MKAEPIKATVAMNARAVRVPAFAPAWLVPLLKGGLVIADVILALASFGAAFYLRHYEPILSSSPRATSIWSRSGGTSSRRPVTSWMLRRR